MSNEQSTSPGIDVDESAWLALTDLEWFGPRVASEVFDLRVQDLFERLKFLRGVLHLNIADSVGRVMYSVARSFATVIYVSQQYDQRNTTGQSSVPLPVELRELMAEIVGQSLEVMKTHYPEHFHPVRETTLEDLEGWLEEERVKLAELLMVANDPAKLPTSRDIHEARVRCSRSMIDQFEAEIALIKLQRQADSSAAD